MNVICPVCRSDLKAKGSLSPTAPAISVVNCPVCTAPIWLSGGFPIPTRWTSFDIVTYRKPTVTWKQVEQSAIEKSGIGRTDITTPNPNDQKSIYKDTDILGALADAPENIAKSIGDFGGTILGGTVSGLAKSSVGPVLLIGAVIFVVLALRK